MCLRICREHGYLLVLTLLAALNVSAVRSVQLAPLRAQRGVSHGATIEESDPPPHKELGISWSVCG